MLSDLSGLATYLAKKKVLSIRSRSGSISIQVPTLLINSEASHLEKPVQELSYILENSRVVMEGTAKSMRDNEDVKEFYLGISGEGRQSYRDFKQYRRRKRWL